MRIAAGRPLGGRGRLVNGEAGHRSLFRAALFALGALTLAAQVSRAASPDMAFLLYAGGRVLDGARLYRDIVEINPPLIVWLNVGVAFLARAWHLSEFFVYRVATFAVVVALFCFCARLVGRYLVRDDPAFRRWLLLLLFFALFPFSGDDFGQREHFVLALLAPYLLLVAARVAGRAPAVRFYEAAAIGLLAGLALALKPHFGLAWLALEGYQRLRRPADRWRLSPELAGTFALLAAYVGAIALLTPEYFKVAMELGPTYVRYLREPLSSLILFAPGAAVVFLALLAHVALQRYERDQILTAVLTTGVVGCYLAGVAQQKGLPYHFYPAEALAYVLLGLIALDGPPRAVRLSERVYSQVSRAAALTLALLTLGGAAIDALGGSPSEREAREDLYARARFIRSHAAGRPVGVLSYHLDGAFPLITYAGVRLASRFPHLWLLPASYWDALVAGAPLDYRDPAEMAMPERFMWDAVRQDLLQARPALLLVLRPAHDVPRNGLRRFQYIRYFGRDPELARLFEGYELIAEEGEYLVYGEIPAGAARTGPPPSADPGTLEIRTGSLSGMHLQIADPRFLAGVVLFGVLWALIAVRDRRAASAPRGA